MSYDTTSDSELMCDRIRALYLNERSHVKLCLQYMFERERILYQKCGASALADQSL